MEWIEVNGRTMAEARERALDLLGVHESELEIEVIAEGKTGFLGLGRADTRIRARVKPVSREKPQDRRRRRGRDQKEGKDGKEAKGAKDGGETKSREAAQRAPKPAAAGGAGSSSGGTSSSSSSRRRRRGGANRPKPSTDGAPTTAAGATAGASGEPAAPTTGGAPARPARAPKAARPESTGGPSPTTSKEPAVADISTQEQADVARELLEGLLDIMELDGQVSVSVNEDDVIEASVSGAQLGLLVGSKGATLSALEELARAAVSHAAGGHGARLHLDVADFRLRRRAALASFTEQIAQEVRETGRAKSLEPMGAADRKVVHDTASAIEGVVTSSAGEEPRRYVVISPAGD